MASLTEIISASRMTTAVTLRWGNTRTRTHSSMMIFHCNAGKDRYRNKVWGESSPYVLSPQVMAKFQSGASRVPWVWTFCVCCLSLVRFPSLRDRQRRVFDPGYLASSTLSQPLESSQGNWLTVWSPPDSTLVQDTDTHTHMHTHTNTFNTCKCLLMDSTHSHIHLRAHVAHIPL